jgi:hypothetical protein
MPYHMKLRPANNVMNTICFSLRSSQAGYAERYPAYHLVLYHAANLDSQGETNP